MTGRLDSAFLRPIFDSARKEADQNLALLRQALTKRMQRKKHPRRKRQKAKKQKEPH